MPEGGTYRVFIVETENKTLWELKEDAFSPSEWIITQIE